MLPILDRRLGQLDRCAQVGLFPVAYTIGTDFKSGPRKPMDRIIHWNEW